MLLSASAYPSEEWGNRSLRGWGGVRGDGAWWCGADLAPRGPWGTPVSSSPDSGVCGPT